MRPTLRSGIDIRSRRRHNSDLQIRSNQAGSIHMKFIDNLFFVLICCIWGVSFLLMRVAGQWFGHFEISMIRSYLGAGVLLALWALRRSSWPLGRRDLLVLLALSVIGYAVPFSIQPFVIRQAQAAAWHGSSFAAILVALVPLFTVAAQAMLLRIWPTLRQWIGVLGGLFLVFSLAWDEISQGISLKVFTLGVLSPLGYAVANTVVKWRFSRMPAMALAASAMGMAALMVTPMIGFDQPPRLGGAFPRALGCVLALGVVSTGLGGFVFYRLIQREGPLYAGMVGYVIPCLAVAIGSLSGEQITIAQCATLAGILAMVAVAQSGSRSVAKEGSKDRRSGGA